MNIGLTIGLGRLSLDFSHSLAINRPFSGMYMIKRDKRVWKWAREGKQGRIHGNPVADGWAGAAMRKPLETQKCDQPTWQGVESRVRD